MAYKARFVHGSRYFNLDSGEYDLFQDFSFPAVDESLNASPSPAGSMTGGMVVSKTAEDRWWSWSVRIQGSSGAQTHMAARRLSAWLNGAIADKSDKLYFEYTPNYVIPAPVWGQHGAPYRFEVKAAIVDLDGAYYHYTIPDQVLIVPISLYIGPYALGARQRLAQAKGTIIEDTMTSLDGLSRGTIISGWSDNNISNPIFANSTWDTGWTAAANCIAQLNTDPEYVYIGSRSAQLTATAATLRTFTQSINVGNTNPHIIAAWVKKPDGSAVTSSDVDLFYNGSVGVDGAYACGNGWYLVWASITGVASAVSAGVYPLPTNSTIYVGGVSVHETTGLRNLVYGDMLGASWGGTAHESVSAGSAGYLRIPTTGIIDKSAGSIMVAIKHNQPYTRPTNGILFTDGVLNAYYNVTADKYYFTDGTNILSGGAAQTFAYGDIQVLHFVWGKSGLAVYLNGSAYDSGTSFTPWTVGEYLYIGSDATPASHIGATFLGMSIWDKQLTAAQVAADYALISPHIRGGDGLGQRLSSIPYLWTKDGDNQVDNYTDATHNHYAIAAGIQGSTEAETEITGTAGTAFGGIHLSNFVTQRFFSPSIFFVDSSGTADAAAVGGQAHVTATGQSNIELAETGMSWYKYQYPEFSAMEFYILARMKAASTIYGRIQPYIASSGYAVNTSTDNSPIYSMGNAYLLYRTNAGITEKNYTGYDSGSEYIQTYGYVSAGTVNVSLDYMAVFPRPYLYCYTYKTAKFTLRNKSLVVESAAPFVGKVTVLHPIGDPIEFTPNRYNILQSLMGCPFDDPSLSYTLTYDIYYTPRYLLI